MPKAISIDDGRTQVTVSSLLANPETIPTRAVENLRNKFVAESMLTDGGTASTLEFSFERAEKSFLDGDPEPIAEFGEFPTLSPLTGEQVFGRAQKTGFRVEVSREMKDYNNMREINKRMIKAENTFVRWNERQLIAALLDAPIPEIAASVAWNQPGADIRYDIAQAMEKVASGGVVYIDEETHEDWNPNQIVMHKSLSTVFISDPKWNEPYQGSPLAEEASAYTGKLPINPLGLEALGMRSLAKDRVLVLQKGAPGFYVDPRRLEATPMRGQGGDPYGGDNETYSSRLSQIRFVGIDEPFSACWITGVMA